MSEGQQLDTVARLQGYLRWAARREAAVVAVSPFTVFLPTGDAVADAVAIPAAPVGPDGLGGLLARPATGRRLRLSFLAEFAPDLAATLQSSGYGELGTRQLLACGPEGLRPAPVVPGLSMVTLDARSSLAEVREGLDANERGFHPQAAPATDAAAETFRRELVGNRAFTAKLGDTPVGAGMFTPPHEGIAELVGITTLAPYRRRGIGAFVTGYAARGAFGVGVDLLFLSTSDPVARRVYDRLGFRPVATLLAFGLPSRR
jgi:GNAT superfamily N-acetyltransferase